jgi:hypothetical protein
MRVDKMDRDALERIGDYLFEMALLPEERCDQDIAALARTLFADAVRAVGLNEPADVYSELAERACLIAGIAVCATNEGCAGIYGSLRWDRGEHVEYVRSRLEKKP